MISIVGSGYFKSDAGYWSKIFFSRRFPQIKSTRIRANQRGLNPGDQRAMHFAHAGCNFALTRLHGAIKLKSLRDLNLELFVDDQSYVMSIWLRIELVDYINYGFVIYHYVGQNRLSLSNRH